MVQAFITQLATESQLQYFCSQWLCDYAHTLISDAFITTVSNCKPRGKTGKLIAESRQKTNIARNGTMCFCEQTISARNLVISVGSVWVEFPNCLKPKILYDFLNKKMSKLKSCQMKEMKKKDIQAIELIKWCFSIYYLFCSILSCCKTIWVYRPRGNRVVNIHLWANVIITV